MSKSVHQICMQEPHCQVPSVAGHGLSYWLWYHNILVGQRECINTFLKDSCPGLEQCICWYWCNACWSEVSYTLFFLCVNWHPRLGIDTNYTCINGETNYDNGFATSKSEHVYAYPSSHYVVNIMKAANHQRLIPLDLCWFGLDMKGGILALAVSHAPAGPNTPTGHNMWLCSTGKGLQHTV